MKGAPFRTITYFRKQEFVLSPNLPSLQRLLLLAVLKTNDVILPRDGTPLISAHPATVQVHVDVDIDIAIDINRHVRCGNGLSQR